MHNFQDLNNLHRLHNFQDSINLRPIGKLFKIQIIWGISFDNFAISFWSLNLKMADDDSRPWGTLQCTGKLAGHRLLDWSFYALILVFPVSISYLEVGLSLSWEVLCLV
jgi:hypothetical protein